MTPKRTITGLALALGAFAPLAAQTPLFTDGPAFGGSKIFSEGRNPLGNSARYDQPQGGYYFTYLDGDNRAQDNKSSLQGAVSADAVAASAALAKLKDAPWAQRSRAFGFASIRNTVHFAVVREELNGLTAVPDLNPADLGSNAALLNNTTQVNARRAVVERMSFGGGSSTNGTGFGASLRLERWSMGARTGALNPWPGAASLSEAESLLGYTGTQNRTLTYAMDMGFVTELAQGLRLGVTVDQLNPKVLWEVHLKPQFRAGLQIALGPSTSLSMESDINGVEKMPFPVKQQTTSASLRFETSPAVALVLGAQRRKLGDAAVTQGGITLQLRTPSLLVAVGLQLGQDRPLRGATAMVN
jgi:hypothetical protein